MKPLTINLSVSVYEALEREAKFQLRTMEAQLEWLLMKQFSLPFDDRKIPEIKVEKEEYTGYVPVRTEVESTELMDGIFQAIAEGFNTKTKLLNRVTNVLHCRKSLVSEKFELWQGTHWEVLSPGKRVRLLDTMKELPLGIKKPWPDAPPPSKAPKVLLTEEKRVARAKGQKLINIRESVKREEKAKLYATNFTDAVWLSSLIKVEAYLLALVKISELPHHFKSRMFFAKMSSFSVNSRIQGGATLNALVDKGRIIRTGAGRNSRPYSYEISESFKTELAKLRRDLSRIKEFQKLVV